MNHFLSLIIMALSMISTSSLPATEVGLSQKGAVLDECTVDLPPPFSNVIT